MNCDEYRRWFEVALSGPLPVECPLDEYRRHVVSCPQCQLLLSLDDVSETIAQVARLAPSGDDPATIERAVGLVRKRARKKKRVRASSIVGVAALLAAAIWVLLASSGRAVPPVASPPPGPDVAVTPPPAPAKAVTPEEFARSLLTEDYGLRKARIHKLREELTLSFERKNPEADQYEWVKHVLLSGLETKFPTVEAYIVFVNEKGKNVLMIEAPREHLTEMPDWYRELTGPEFCRSLIVLHDRDGLAKRPEDKE